MTRTPRKKRHILSPEKARANGRAGREGPSRQASKQASRARLPLDRAILQTSSVLPSLSMTQVCGRSEWETSIPSKALGRARGVKSRQHQNDHPAPASPAGFSGSGIPKLGSAPLSPLQVSVPPPKASPRPRSLASTGLDTPPHAD